MRLKILIINFTIYIFRNFPNTHQIKALIKKQLVIKIAAMLVCINCFNFCYGQQNQEHIVGKWISLRKNVIVEVFKTGNEYRSKIVWFDDSDDKNRPMLVRTDYKNPEPSLRKRKLIGLEVMYGLSYNEKLHEWQDGKIYDASKGKHWNAKAWITKEGILNVRGYWHLELLGQNISFKKIS
jgi:uncharacterized protein (DUF2147 family)